MRSEREKRKEENERGMRKEESTGYDAETKPINASNARKPKNEAATIWGGRSGRSGPFEIPTVVLAGAL